MFGKNNKKQPAEIVDITSPTFNSMLGRYFIGQTGMMTFGNRHDAWGGIINPSNSGINLYFDIFTITNFSSVAFTSEIWLNLRPPKNATISRLVTPSNQSLKPPPKPKAIMEYAGYITEPLKKGTNIFDRITAPNSTLVSDSHQGSIIIPPGGSFSVVLKSPGGQTVTGTVVLTWWEEKNRFELHRGRIT